ncbi:MAG TPA: hypothetical protein VFW22_16485 [Pseudolabrys sp.]|nr:hypothetical protein [Pseudolabrys sp.]
MSESAGAAVVTGGDQGDQGAGDQQQQQQQQQQVNWRDALPEDLRGNEQLSRYADLEAFARGHLETKHQLSSRALIPAADAGADVWGQFYTQLGRPAEAAGYDFKVPDGEKSDLADAFRPIAFEEGLTAKQATRIADFWNSQNEAGRAADKATLEAFKAEKGADYPRIEQAAIAAFKQMGLEPDFPEALSRLTTSGALIKGFAKMAELIGEHGRKDPDDPQDNLTGVPDSQAEAKLDELKADKDFVDKLMKKDPSARAQHARLLEQAKRYAARQLGG